jgi:3-hydroxyisobutyrate dehydrogenase
LDAGYDLTVYNRTKSKTEELQSKAAKTVDSPKEAIKNSDVVIAMVADYNAVCEVLFEDESALKGKSIIQMSTISPSESSLVEERVKNLGAEFIEAPVLGSVPQAEGGKLIVMVAGSKDKYAEYESLLKNFGEKVVYAGEVQKATSMKIALNQLIASLTAAFSQSLALIREKDVDIDLFMDVLKGSPLFAPTFDKKMDNMLSRDFSKANFPAKHLLKDVKLFLDEARPLGMKTEPLQGVKSILINAVEDKLGENDYSTLYQIIHPDNK